MAIFEQNRNKGIYLVDAKSLQLPEGETLERTRYQLHLLPQNQQTLITVHYPESSNRAVVSERDARIILNQILSAYQVFRTTG